MEAPKYIFEELQASLASLCRFVCQEIPEKWTMELEFTKDELQVTLIDPNGDIVTKYCPYAQCDKVPNRCSDVKEVIGSVAHARYMDGLSAVWPQVQNMATEVS